jgi:hypothetical protein
LPHNATNTENKEAVWPEFHHKRIINTIHCCFESFEMSATISTFLILVTSFFPEPEINRKINLPV